MPRVLRRDRKSYPGEGGDSHGEESKGREEEGCEEAIACPRTLTPNFQNSGGWELASLVRCHTIPHADPPQRIPRHQAIHDIHPIHDVPEDRVAAIEMRLR